MAKAKITPLSGIRGGIYSYLRYCTNRNQQMERSNYNRRELGPVYTMTFVGENENIFYQMCYGFGVLLSFAFCPISVACLFISVALLISVCFLCLHFLYISVPCCVDVLCIVCFG